MPDPADAGLQPLAGIDRLIHEPARLMILATLFVIETADFLFVERQTGLTRGNLSAHLTRLEEAGYVEINKKFVDKIPRTLLRITDQGNSALLEYTDSMQQVLGKLQ